MNKNEIFRRYLKIAVSNNLIELEEDQIHNLNINSDCQNPLINIIRIAILSLDQYQTVDYATRKINQFLRRDLAVNGRLWEEVE